jgi:hypothetical protein
VRAPASEKQPANRHVPHNVIEIVRPSEKSQEALDKSKVEESLAAERLDLKADQLDIAMHDAVAALDLRPGREGLATLG